jgi:hypothetical protein
VAWIAVPTQKVAEETKLATIRGFRRPSCRIKEKGKECKQGFAG